MYLLSHTSNLKWGYTQQRDSKLSHQVTKKVQVSFMLWDQSLIFTPVHAWFCSKAESEQLPGLFGQYIPL